MCEWPAGVRKPLIPVPYAEECMHGFEYQAAAHMIQSGLEQEGLDIVRGVRGRYNGENRNPWNEMECGSNYARSMASWALLLAYSGFSYDMTRLEIGFKPLRDGSYFWSLDKAWGSFEQKGKTAALRVLYGTQTLRRLRLEGSGKQHASLEGRDLQFSLEGDTLVFERTLELREGHTLSLR
jgi:hypothetical protein